MWLLVWLLVRDTVVVGIGVGLVRDLLLGCGWVVLGSHVSAILS